MGRVLLINLFFLFGVRHLLLDAFKINYSNSKSSSCSNLKRAKKKRVQKDLMGKL